MEKVVKITKENLELMKDILIDMALVEINLLDSNKYFNLASKIDDDQEIIITAKEAMDISECIYKYIEFNRFKDIDIYLGIINNLIG